MAISSLTFRPEGSLDKVGDGDGTHERAQASVVSLVHLGIVVQNRLATNSNTGTKIKTAERNLNINPSDIYNHNNKKTIPVYHNENTILLIHTSIIPLKIPYQVPGTCRYTTIKITYY